MSTILLVDDDRSFQELAARVLEANGHKVLQAGSGADGMAIAERGGPHLMVVDGLLPDTDGVTWIAQLRAQGCKLPVVFVSAFWHDLGSYSRLTKELGVALVMRKPVNAPLFAARIQALLAGQEPAPLRADAAVVEALVRALGADYARALRSRGLEIAIAVRSLRVEPSNPGLRGEAMMLAHRLRGTAGSYGFHEVGEAAGHLEDALESTTGTQARSDGWAAADDALTELTHAVDAARPPGDGPAKARAGRPPASAETEKEADAGRSPRSI